jgi:pimeloyl-ACP methyl ester carboxylesterase
MRKFFSPFLLFALLLALVPAVWAQPAAADLAGTWQGTLHAGAGLRTVLKITPDGAGGWKGEMYSIDQVPTPFPLDTVTLSGAEFAFALHAFNAKYHGTLSADGKSIKGTMTQGQDLPLEFERATAATEWKIDASPHKVSFVEVEPGVKLEVLDWGGTGRPLILLAGLGSDAHVFDNNIAPKLAVQYHVYGITRRGFGSSSVPAPTAENFSAHRLGDDVLAVMDVLKIEQPVLAGHSMAGEELSSIGIHHPEKVAGLIYLDAGYPYAYYDPATAKGDPEMDWAQVRQEMDLIFKTASSQQRKEAAKLLAERDLPRFDRDIQKLARQLAEMPDNAPSPSDSPMARSAGAVMLGVEVHGGVKCPALAIYALPHDFSKIPLVDEKKRAELSAEDTISTGAQADAFAKGNPQARVVRLPNADHAVFASNEADVLREMDAFIATLK